MTMNVKGKKISVLGAGVSGLRSALFLKEEGADVFLSEIGDENRMETAVETLKREGIDFEFGRHDFRRIADSDLAIISPGIAPSTDLYRHLIRAKLKIWSEVELAFHFAHCDIVAVTGTNGTATLRSVLRLRAGGMGWGQIAHEIGVAPGAAASAASATQAGGRVSGSASVAGRSEGNAAKGNAGITAAGGGSVNGTVNGAVSGSQLGRGIVTAAGTQAGVRAAARSPVASGDLGAAAGGGVGIGHGGAGFGAGGNAFGAGGNAFSVGGNVFGAGAGAIGHGLGAGAAGGSRIGIGLGR